MAKIEAHEVFEVSASFEDAPRRVVTPHSIYCDSIDEALDVVRLVVSLDAVAIVSREVVETVNPPDPDLDDWPSRHVVEQEQTTDGWRPIEKKTTDGK